jgi:uncharacterized protein (TIGR02145 family)
VAYGTAQNPTTANNTTSNGTGTGTFTSTLTGLTASTLYYVRAYATNSVGTAYGNEVSFTTSAAGPQPCPGTPTVTDVDNNTYNTVQIGTQCWTQSNLKTSRFRNGVIITNSITTTAWAQPSPSWCNYNNIISNDILYGKLYNWYAVNSSNGLCPIGWHVPSNSELDTLINFLGGSSVAGGALKSTVTQPTSGGWAVPNIGATNTSGFTVVPGGYRSLSSFLYVGITGGFWTSTPSSSWAVYFSFQNNSSGSGGGTDHPAGGFSIRCLKD